MSRSVSQTGPPKDLPASSARKLETPRQGLVCAEYSLVRAAQRFVPKGPRGLVTVAVADAGFPLAFGDVRDLSESGACMVTDFVLGRGRTFQLELKMEEKLVLETEARIVWSGEGKDWQGAVVGAVLQGVEFARLSDALRQRLKDLFASGAFDLAPRRGQVRGSHASSFQEVLDELQPELHELGIKVSPS